MASLACNCPKCGYGIEIPAWALNGAHRTANPAPPPVQEANEKASETKEPKNSSLPNTDAFRAQLQLAGTLGVLCAITAADAFNMDAIDNDDLWGLFSLLDDLQEIAFSDKK